MSRPPPSLGRQITGPGSYDTIWILGNSFWLEDPNVENFWAGCHGVGRWGSWSQPTYQLSVEYRMVSSGSKSDAASLLHTGRQINVNGCVPIVVHSPIHLGETEAPYP